MAKANGFTFFANYFEAINDPDAELTDEQKGIVYNAIITYVFTGEEIPLKGAVKAIFKSILPSLDNSRAHISSSKSERKANVNETQSERKANVNETQSETNDEKAFEKRLKSVQNTPFLEETEIETEKEINIYKGVGKIIGGSRGEEEPPQTKSEQELFLDRHSEIVQDVVSYSDAQRLQEVDFPLLEKKIAESSILRENKSLAFLAHNWEKIKIDRFKDFESRKQAKSTQTGSIYEQFQQILDKAGSEDG